VRGVLFTACEDAARLCEEEIFLIMSRQLLNNASSSSIERRSMFVISIDVARASRESYFRVAPRKNGPFVIVYQVI
jgi:hypothetical protein